MAEKNHASLNVADFGWFFVFSLMVLTFLMLNSSVLGDEFFGQKKNLHPEK